MPPREFSLLLTLHYNIYFWGAELVLCEVRPESFRKKRGSAPKERHGLRAKHLYKDCGVTAGKVQLSAGTDNNLQRPIDQVEAEGYRKVLNWPMSPYERRGRGNAFLKDGKRLTRKGNTLKGQRGSRHLAGTKAAQLRTQGQRKPDRRGVSSRRGNHDCKGCMWVST